MLSDELVETAGILPLEINQLPIPAEFMPLTRLHLKASRGYRTNAGQAIGRHHP